MRLAFPGARLIDRARYGIARAWLARRVPPEPSRIRLHRRRLFILPTRAGYTFGITLALLLLGSLNYDTSLGFAVTFLLVGSGSIGMLQTHNNLNGVRLDFGASRAVFAGEMLRLPLELQVDAARRWALQLEGADTQPAPLSPGPDCPATTELSFRTRTRGRFRPPRLRITTSWPYGLLRVWSWVWPRVEGLVYPACIDHGVAPPQADGDGRERPRSGGDEDFAGLREYQPGDRPQRIAWRVFARTDELLVKTFASNPAGERWFDWTTLGSLAPEKRLEQLCHWIVAAEHAGPRYGLSLPGQRIEPGSGPAHRARCLECLALFGQPDDGLGNPRDENHRTTPDDNGQQSA